MLQFEWLLEEVIFLIGPLFVLNKSLPLRWYTMIIINSQAVTVIMNEH